MKYLPVLHGKPAELEALKHLGSTVSAKLLPLIDLKRLSLNESGEPIEAPEQHFGKVLQKIFTSLGPGREFLLNSSGTATNCRCSDGRSYQDWLFERCRELGLAATPVTGFDRDEEYQDIIKAIKRADRRGLAVRLDHEDVKMGPMDVESNLQDLLGRVGATRSDVVLILDSGAIAKKDVEPLAGSIRKLLSGLSRIEDYREIAVVASSMPLSLKNVVANGTMARVPRVEMALWREILKSQPRRMPAFGDYGVVAPAWVEPTGPVHTSPNIKYATEMSWLLVRGQPFHRHPQRYDQYFTLAKSVANDNQFLGDGYSWGDNYIGACARREVGHGGLQTWISVGTNHHLTFVANQVARILSAV